MVTLVHCNGVGTVIKAYRKISHDKKKQHVNPVVTNGLSNLYHLDEFIFNFRYIKSNFSFLFYFLKKFVKQT